MLNLRTKAHHEKYLIFHNKRSVPIEDMKNRNPISSLNEDSFTCLEHYGPITAIKLVSNYILCGYGPILKVFKLDEDDREKLIFKKKVINRNKIHHIAVSVSGNKVIVSGGRSFKVLNFSDIISNSAQVDDLREKCINEWIICSEFLSDDYCIILTSHNIVYKVDVKASNSSQDFYICDKIHCNEKSILYSGSLSVIEGKVIVAAGTVMNGVIIWDLEKRTIIHNLVDHEGSIFGVTIDDNRDFIVSCSDDRTVRLFDFQTGKQLAIGWGHGSRIWGLKFLKNSHSTRIFSIGEDCSARIWEYEKSSSTLKQIKFFENHSGKHIWSGDVDDQNLNLCVTGGADGRLLLTDISGIDQQCTKSYSKEAIFNSSVYEFAKNEIIKQFVELVDLQLLVILTSLGSILILDEKNGQWSKLNLDEDEREVFDNFGILKSCNSLRSVCVCSREGRLLMLHFNTAGKLESKKWHEPFKHQGEKVTNYFDVYDRTTGSWYILFDCSNPKVPFLLVKVNFSDDDVVISKSYQLLKPENAMFTCSSLSFDNMNSWIVLGSRLSSIAIYDLSKDSDDITGNVCRKITPGDTITSVSIMASDIDSAILLLTLRDGYYSFLQILSTRDGLQISVLHMSKISRGFLERGFIQDHELILCGFRSSSFFMWNETKRIEFCSEVCGGIHRQWDIIRQSKQPMSYKFIYVNKSTLHTRLFTSRFSIKHMGELISGTHGREIRDITFSPYHLKDDSRLFLTASEDTNIRLGKIFSYGKMQNIWTMNDHISGLQRVKFLNSSFAASSAANEEFFIWKIQIINGSRPFIFKYASLPQESDHLDLRIMDFDSFQYKDGMIISTVYSNSQIRIWFFDPRSRKFSLLVDDSYTACCILNTKFIKISDFHVYLLISATDGHIALWNIGEIIAQAIENSETESLDKVIVKQQLHQNSVKAIQLTQMNDLCYRLVTGGDDNSLTLSHLQFSENYSSVTIETKSFIEKAASSTITSIAYSGNQSYIVSSVDQVVREWKHEEEALKCVAAKYSTVADTGCVEATNFQHNSVIALGGAGLSAWALK
ncbi:Piso0_000809 [Millerozyma farinosa CBS 7064]|uniref:Piso0_000809 protein n=1 Tax=Pichia sorbitophila (strain ATCC MYA-4447 / BCRC 22081 / CBS 7064 / NBRC 10061 / NRRL Y-12695) TaxID=559304 RepID=G8YRK5_PICSO|nr:Piso0_000809 [Millerozyma farinosa CBS 7064]